VKIIKKQLNRKETGRLKAGERLRYWGVLYTARDQAHRRLIKAIRGGQRTPLDLRDKIIYYCGPTKTPKGKVIGSCGPTTSSRMDEFTPLLLKAGVLGMIGKGGRSSEVERAIRRSGGVYFLTFAGCGALLAKYVKSARPVAYRDLGPEAIYRLEVENFPLIVGVDSRGKSII